jgi:NADPH:quinone reductase-like Zn-dependent oxidoreductase
MRLVLGVFKPRRQVLGGYLAGEVIEVGDSVTRFEVGNRVYGSSALRFGGYGEEVCLPESHTLSIIPHAIGFAEAATVPLGALNALHFMNLANIQAGQRVLINGAGGSIGAFAVQIAKARGGQITAIDAGQKADFLTQLGADRVIDYRETPLEALQERFDVILNMVGQTQFDTAIALLSDNGTYLTANPKIADMWQCRRFNKRNSGQRAYSTFASETQKELDQISDLLERGVLKPILDRTFTLEQAAQAHEYVETEQRLGAVALKHM